MKEEIEMARQYLEKEQNGTLDLENLSEDEKQMRIFSEAYDKSGLAEIVDGKPAQLFESFWDGKKFHYRQLNGEFQIYSKGLENWAIVATDTRAKIIMDSLEQNFKNAVTKIAGGQDEVEDFKFFAPDMKNPDELLKASTQMLNEEGKELREC